MKKEPKRDPIWEIVGKGHSKYTDLSYHHDTYIYGSEVLATKRRRRRKRA